MGSGGSAAGNYDIIKGLCYLGVKNKEREERMDKQQHVGHKILSAFIQKNDQLIRPSDVSLKAYMPQESCSEIYICFFVFYHILDHSFTNILKKSCWDWVTSVLIPRFLCIWLDVTLQRIFESLLLSQVLFESLGPIQENESRKCLLRPLHSYAYTLKAVQKVPEVNSELSGNQPEKAVLWCWWLPASSGDGWIDTNPLPARIT